MNQSQFFYFFSKYVAKAPCKSYFSVLLFSHFDEIEPQSIVDNVVYN